VFVESEQSAPWAVAGQLPIGVCRAFMATPQVVVGYHFVIEGEIELRVGDEPTLTVRAGEAVMLPHNDAHVFGSSVRLPATPLKDVMPADPEGIVRIRHDGGGARSHLICGFLGGNDRLAPLLAALPAALVVPIARMPGGDWLSSTFRYAAETMADGGPGGRAAVTRLSELLFVETMRRYLADLPAEQTGWLAALRDPAIGRAVGLLHSRIGEAWTAEALARAVNMSRSAFADRFTALIGQPPMRYLTGWRMQLARQRLAETRLPIAQIGYEIGYASEAAFTRAFRREHGAPPAAWRRQAA
jgi:AraC-like DNA-binding protein